MCVEMQLIKKIHEGADGTCFAGILKAWNMDQMNLSKQSLERKQEIERLHVKGYSIKEISRILDISMTTVRRHMKEYTNYLNHSWLTEPDDNEMYDRLWSIESFFEHCEKEIKQSSEDVYFTVNSFWRPDKSEQNVRHLNCFVLDFDYYKLKQFDHLQPMDFYNKKLKHKLPFKPTAVIDSGRGLYVLYAFHHCSYHFCKLYKSIGKSFYKQYASYGLDQKAMNVTQVIRLPGTLNTKSLDEVKILELHEDTDYSIQDFAMLLPYSYEEVMEHKSNSATYKPLPKEKSIEEKAKRKPYFKDFYDDMKKLIQLRNHAQIYEGYREMLLFIVRERACWSGYTIDESVKFALELNALFHCPMKKSAVEKQCKPSRYRQKCSIDTIIHHLDITTEEMKQMKIIRPRWMKKQAYAKRKCRHRLLNMSEKQYEILQRRTKVCELKFKKRLRNKEIADLLQVDKATITRDVEYILSKPNKFQKKLQEYMNELEGVLPTTSFKRKTVYEKQKQLLEWLKTGYSALDFLIREFGVANI